MASKKLDVSFSDSNGANEKRKRLTFERPDIAHVRGEICRRFEVDVREMTIQARVTVRGSQKEYAVSSSEDLVDLWEEIEEIYVVVPVARPAGLAVVFNENEEARRITFESQDFNEIVEQVCVQFQAEQCSLAGKIEGDETKYSLTSNDDVSKLWNHLEKLFVTGKKKRQAGLAVIFNNDEKKRITFQSKDFYQIIALILAQFNAESCSLECTIEGDETKYSITSNEDVIELWSDIEKLYVTGKKKRLKVDTKVMCDQSTYYIDQEPDPNSKLVLRFRSDEDVEAMMEADACFRMMGDLTNIMYYAAVGTGNVDMQVKTNDIGFKVIDICHSADNTISSYVMACSEVHEMFHKAVQYLLEDDHKRALRVIASLAGTAERCKEKTEALISLTDETMKAHLLLVDEKQSGGKPLELQIIFAERNAAIDLYEKSEQELSVAKQQWSELQSNAVTSQQNHENQSSGGSTGAKIAACASATTLGTAAVCATAATLAAPVFFIGIAAIGLGAYIVNKVTGYQDRKREAEERRKREAAERRQHLKEQLSSALEKVAKARSNKECFSALVGELVIMRSSLLKIKAFFNQLLGFCGTIQTSEDGVIQEFEETQGSLRKLDCRQLLESPGTKLEMVYYQAKWVALKHVCQDCQRTLIHTNKELHKRIEENPTRQEAKAALGDMVKNAKRTYKL